MLIMKWVALSSNKAEIFEVQMLQFWVILLFIPAWVQHRVESATFQSDVFPLNVLYTSLNSPPQLTKWSSTGGDPCGELWKGITCSGSHVTEVNLSDLGLNGSLGYNLADMVFLTNLDVSNNNIGAGSSIPYGIPPNLRRLDISGNQFGGNLPYSLSQMSSLTYLNVSKNNLQGTLMDMFNNNSHLSSMDLSFNNFSGNIPPSFSNLTSLATLYLQNNQFTGSLDVFINLPLVTLNTMHNKFNSTIPTQLKGIKNFQSDTVSWGSSPAPVPSSPQVTAPPGWKMDPGRKTDPNRRSNGISGPSRGSGDKSGVSFGVVAGIIVAGLFVGIIIAFFLIKWKQKVASKKEIPMIEQPCANSPYEINETKSSQTSLHTGNPAIHAETSFGSLKPPLIEQKKSFNEDNLINKSTMQSQCGLPANATAYSVSDLQVATGSFNSENLVGEGSFGRVYRAQFDDGKVFAVKKITSSALPNQTPEYFLDMVTKLSQLRHQNVTELVGYCCEHGQSLLVFEFHKNGSLQDLLHLSDEYSKPLTWNTRIKIALGTARALEYLHEVCSPSIVHRNIKSANILLDHELNAHLSDCGLSDLILTMERQVSDPNLGFGYSAPEVVMSGQYSLKSDVYSFGVVMLELLTARKPFDGLRRRSEQSLVRWATPQLHDIDALDKMVDPALKGLYPAKSLSRIADIIALCVQPEPEFRPPMSEVVQALVRLVQRANMSRRVGSADEQETPRLDDDRDRLRLI